MTLQIDVYSPSVSTGPVRVFRAGGRNERLMDGLPAVPRRTDLYTSTNSVASIGTWRMKVSNRDAIFSPDGLFAPDMREVLCSAKIGERIVFLGRPTKLAYDSNGIVAYIHWRDFLDDFLTQQVTGVDTESVRTGLEFSTMETIEDDLKVIAEASLNQAMEAFGFPRYVKADGTKVPPDEGITLWYPETTTTIRQWLLPVFASLGLSFDWQAVEAGGRLTPSLRASWEGEFLNRDGIPAFTDRHLLKMGKWDDGRQQVANLWEGQLRWWDDAEREFKTRDLETRVSYALGSAAVRSRAAFGERKSRMRFDQIRAGGGPEGTETIIGLANAMLSRRLWEHARVTMTLVGDEAAALRVGDGFVAYFNLGTSAGRGFNRVCRVIGRTLVVREDARDSSVEIYAEVRDGRDEDYVDWFANGHKLTIAPNP